MSYFNLYKQNKLNFNLKLEKRPIQNKCRIKNEKLEEKNTKNKKSNQ